MLNSFFKTGIYSQYTVSSTPSFAVNPWVVYNAKSIKTKQRCSLFKFDKKLFEQYVYESSNGSFNNLSRSTYKMILAEATSYVRTYVNNMIKFKHPNILSVIEPLEERQNSMIFVTELVTNDLQNFVKDSIQKDNYSENELILMNGLSQICGALEFLHDNGVAHLNLIPSSVFITEKLDFKLSGFNFCEKTENGDYNLIVPDERFPKFLSLPYDYSDPSLILDHHLSTANDIFSLGCLIYYLFNFKPGKKLIDSNNDLYDYKAGVNKIRSGGVKARFSDEILSSNFQASMVNLSPNMRFSIQEFKNSKFFNNELLNSLDFINNFNSKTLIEKNVFLKGFDSRNFFAKFPKFVLNDKFLPILKETLTSISNIVIFPITLKCIFKIAKDLSNMTYIEVLLDAFKPIIIKSNNKKVELNILSFTEIQLVILDNLKSILEKINTSTAGNFKKVEKSFLIPLINNILADGAMSIEQLQVEANNNAVQNAFNTVKTLGQISPEKLRIQEKFLSNLSLIISTLNKQNEAASKANGFGGSGVPASVAEVASGVANNVTNALSGNANTTKFIESEVFPKVAQLFKTTSSLTIRVEVIKNFISLVKDRVLSSSFASKKVLPLLINIKQKNDQLILNGLYDFYKLYLEEEDLYDKSLLIDTIIPEIIKLTFNNNELTIAKFNDFFNLIGGFQNKLKEKHLVYLQKYNESNIIKHKTLAAQSEGGSSMASPVMAEQATTFESILNGRSNKNTMSDPTSPSDIDDSFSSLKMSSSSTQQLKEKTSPKISQPPILPKLSQPSILPKKNNLGSSFGVMQPTRNGSAPAISQTLSSSPAIQPLKLEKTGPIKDWSSTPRSTSNTSSSAKIDWSAESNKLNTGVLSLSSKNVLQPRKASSGNSAANTAGKSTDNSTYNGNTTLSGNSTLTTNGFGSTTTKSAVPPGFSINMIQPLKPKINKNSNSDKRPSDDFFDSFI